MTEGRQDGGSFDEALSVIRPFAESGDPELRGNAAHALALLANDTACSPEAEALLVGTLVAKQPVRDIDWVEAFRAKAKRAVELLRHPRERVMAEVRRRLDEAPDPARHSVAFEILLEHLAKSPSEQPLSWREMFRFVGAAGQTSYLQTLWECGWRIVVLAALTIFSFAGLATLNEWDLRPRNEFDYLWYLLPLTSLSVALAMRFSIAGRPLLSYRQKVLDSLPPAFAGAVAGAFWTLTGDSGLWWDGILHGLALGFAIGFACRMIRWLPLYPPVRPTVTTTVLHALLAFLAGLTICYVGGRIGDSRTAAHLTIVLANFGVLVGWMNIWLEQQRPELIRKLPSRPWGFAVAAALASPALVAFALSLLRSEDMAELDISTVRTHSVPLGKRFRLTGLSRAERFTIAARSSEFSVDLTIYVEPPGEQPVWINAGEAQADPYPDLMMEDLTATDVNATTVMAEPAPPDQGRFWVEEGQATLEPETVVCVDNLNRGQPCGGPELTLTELVHRHIFSGKGREMATARARLSFGPPRSQRHGDTGPAPAQAR